MKRILLVLVLISAAAAANAQKSIDALFSKYSGKDGFVSVTISGDLIKLVGHLDDDDDNGDDNVLKSANISEIRILAQDDDELKVENFYDQVMKDIDTKLYEEFMRVKEKNQDVRMLVRTEGNRFREFLLVAGGEDNLLIQVRGNMTYSEVKKLSEKAKNEHGMDLL